MARNHRNLFSDDIAAQSEAVNGAISANALPFRLEDFEGQFYRNKPIFDNEQVIAQLDTGLEIDSPNGTITFGFLDGPTAVGLYNSPRYQGFGATQGFGFQAFTEIQKAGARDTMVLWDDLIAPSIVESNGNGADILFANDFNTFAGQGYYPGTNGQKIRSDVWISSPDVNWVSHWLDYAGAGKTTLIHEAGHALGLSHPGNYNATDADGDGIPDPITYQNAAEYAQDSQTYSIMSYFSGPQTGTGRVVNGAILQFANPQTPMIHDILAIQAKYGADPTTRVGDTNYFSNSNAGNGVYDLSLNPYPYLAVYDAGGEDTFDFSTANRSVFIDLRPGSFSSAGLGVPSLELANSIVTAFNAATDNVNQGDRALWANEAILEFVANNLLGPDMAPRIFADTGVGGLFAVAHRNISIAYNTIIENANGGSARDYLVGNHVSNALNGNDGNDVLNGLGGDDLLSGGIGADEFRFTDLGGNDRISDFASGVDRIALNEIDANSNAAGDQAFSFIGGAAFSGSAGELRSYAQGGENFLAGDVNGDGLADFTINIGSGSAVVSDFLL
jgi:serralysin